MLKFISDGEFPSDLSLCDLNQRNRNGKTGLMIACIQIHLPMIMRAIR